MRSVIVQVGLVSSLLHACFAESTSPTETLLTQIQAQFASVDAFYVEFVQERHLALMKNPVVSEGVICFQKPDSVRWEITKPYRSILVAHDGRIAQFEKANETWEPLRSGFEEGLRVALRHMVLIWEGRFATQSDDFSVSVTDRDGVTVTLSPQTTQRRSMLPTLEIRLSPDLSHAERVDLVQPRGDRTVLRFSSPIRPAPFPDGTFDDKAPLPLADIRAAVLP